MRKKLYEKNYALLKKFAPEMLSEQPPTFSLEHKGEIDPRVKTYAKRIGDSLVRVGTDWPINGEPSYDPLFNIMFDNTLQMARVKYWAMENIMFQLVYGGAIFDRYDCSFESEETKREKVANDFLNEWIKDMVKARKRNPAYFQMIPV